MSDFKDAFMSKQLLNAETDFIDMDDKNFTLKSEQVIPSAFIDDLRDQRYASHDSREGNFMKVASIPVVIHEKWLREGFDLFKEKHKTVLAKLKSENLDAFIATDKKLQQENNMNYGEIRTHFKELLNRTDITPALITKFIEQGNLRIARILRVPAMEHLETYTMDSAGTKKITIPSVFLETIDLYHSGGNTLERVPMSKMSQLRSSDVTGEPRYYTRVQGEFLIHPYPTSGTLSLSYYGEFEPLYDNGLTYDAANDDANETTLTKIAPDLLMYAALTYAAMYYLDEREQAFETKYRTLLGEIQSQADDQESSGGTQVINPAYAYED